MPTKVLQVPEPASLAAVYGLGGIGFDERYPYGPDDAVLRKKARCPTVAAYEEMRTEFPAAWAAFLQLRNILLGKGWQVLDGEGPRGQRNGEIARVILGGIQNLDLLLEELFGYLWTGYAVAAVSSTHELTAGGVTFDAPWYVRRKPPHLFGFSVDRRLIWTEGMPLFEADDDVVFETNPELGGHLDQLTNFVISASTDDPYGTHGAIAPGIWTLMSVWRGSLQKAALALLRALGIIVLDGARAPTMPDQDSGLTDREVAKKGKNLDAMTKRLNQTGVLETASGYSARVESVTGGGEAGVKFLEYLDRQARILILTAALTQTIDGQGSRAAAQTQLVPVMSACKSAGKKFAEAIGDWLVLWVELAIGAAIPPEERPRFSFNLADKTDLDLLKVLLEGGQAVAAEPLAFEAGVELVPEEEEDVPAIRRAGAPRPAVPDEDDDEDRDGEEPPDDEGDEPEE